MDFLLLGPLEAYHGGARVDLGRRRVERCLLGLLLLEAGRVVAVDRLAALLWDDEPPPHARRTVQVHVSRIRSLLDPDRDGRYGVRLAARGDGYLVDVEPLAVDAHRFRSLVERAGGDRDPDTRAKTLRQALALWRGPLLADVATDRVRDRIGVGLDELRLSAWETCLEADLDCGRHHQAVPELTDLVAAHPLRERLVGALMLALYRDGRQPDALDAYRHARDRLADELGLDPGEALQRLHRSILRADPTLELQPPVAPRPAQLSGDVANFVGRDGYLRRLDSLLPEHDEKRPRAVVISAVSGGAGVGKTALAVHWAHRVGDRFPDGQLQVNLRGYDPAAPVRPIEALAGFLRALGVPPEQVPDSVEEAAAMYRSRLAGRQVLIVLDNARDPEQVRPLLPGASGCLVVVTSRDRLTGLVARDGAQRISLDVLAADEARHLLDLILGAERVAAEPTAATELAALCAYLPLALRIAAAKLLDDPGQGIAGFIAAMRGDRLTALSIDGDDGSAVHAAFDLSYTALPDDARRLFRLLGLVPGPDVTAAAAAALADTTPERASLLLDRLTRAHLLDRHQPGRCTFHDLLRVYAAELTHRVDSEADRRSATGRLFDYYLVAVDAAARLLFPHKLRLPLPNFDARPAPVTFDTHALALGWLDVERSNLVAAVGHAAEHGPRPAAWLIGYALRGYLEVRMHTVDWATVAQASLTASRAHGDQQAEAAAHHLLAAVYGVQGRHEAKIDRCTEAVALARRVGWPAGEAALLDHLGMGYLEQGRLDQAVETFTQALALDRKIGNVGGQAIELYYLGAVSWYRGRLEQAAEYYGQARALLAKMADHDVEASSLTALGVVCHGLGRLDQAAAHLVRALDIGRESGGSSSESYALQSLAAVYRDSGRHAEAYELARTALTLARTQRRPADEVAAALNTLATVESQRGNPAQAIAHHQEALRQVRDSRERFFETVTLVWLATAHLHHGNHDQTRAHGHDALTIARESGYRMLEGQALTALAAIDLAAGDLDRTIDTAGQAQVIHRETGHRPGEARTLVVLGHARSRAGNHDAAGACWRQARQLFTEMGMPEGDEIPTSLRANPCTDPGGADATKPAPAGTTTEPDSPEQIARHGLSNGHGCPRI